MKRTCVICGKEFEGSGKQRYCGEECRDIGRRMTCEKSREKRPTRTYTGVCVWCGKTFTWESTHARKRKYCSPECGYKGRPKKPKKIPKPKHDSRHLEKKLDMLKAQGISYADYQRAETLRIISGGRE